MTTGRINQVTDATRRREPTLRLATPTVPFNEGSRPPASGQSERLRLFSTLGGETRSPRRRSTRDSPPSGRRTSRPPGARKTAVVRRRPRRLQTHHGPSVFRRARDRRTQTSQTALPHRSGATACIRTETPRTKLWARPTAPHGPKESGRAAHSSPSTANDGRTMQPCLQRPRATRPRSPTAPV